MRLKARLPVAVTESSGGRRDRELVGNERVMRHHVGGQMREVAVRECFQRVVAGAVQDVKTNTPGMGVTTNRGVLLGNARVGGDGTVQEVIRKGAQQSRDVA